MRSDREQSALIDILHNITLADCNVDGFPFPSAPGVNRIKISATVNSDIAIS